ncbi:MAG TPA: hypothetical protein VGO45_12580 [Bacteroidia bacterium]|jgi:hypothetical protein|nr:hypothetical protein [Bacteroidia bacterium]
MKRKVNINREKPSAEEIRGRRDFNSVLQQYQRSAGTGGASKSFFRSTGFLVSVFAVALASVSVWAYLNYNTNNLPDLLPASKHISETPGSGPDNAVASVAVVPVKMHVAPPLQKLDIPYQNYKMDAAKGGEFKSKNGSRIRIPKNAFADSKGAPLQGEVELRFREFKDPVDFFLGGIPMSYDSAGVRHQFESAGMIELLGYKDLKPVYIIPGKKVEVELDTRYSGPSYSVYKFDTASCNWTFIGKDKVRHLDKNELPEKAEKSKNTSLAFENLPEVKNIDQKLDALKHECETKVSQLPALPAEPREPQKANSSRKRFDIDIDLTEFPEMKEFKSAVFEVGTENKNFTNEAFNTIWDDAQIKEGPRKGVNYWLHLKKGIQTMDIVAYPVFEGKKYTEAMKTYKAEQDKYNTARNQRLAAEKQIRSGYEPKVQELEKNRLELEKAWKSQSRMKNDNEQKTAHVLRAFELSGFGIFSCDMPDIAIREAMASIRLKDKSGKLIPCNTVFLVDASRNSLYTYYQPVISALRFNPSSRNMLWTVADGKLYLVRPEDFKRITNHSDSDVEMTEADQNIKDADAVKAFMGI